MSGNVDPKPRPIFPYSVCARNVTWQGRSVQYCTCSKWVHLMCSLLSFSKFRTLGCSHPWSSSSCCFPTCNIVPSSSDFTGLYTFTLQSDSPLLMLQFRPTLIFKFHIPRPSISYLLTLLPHHRLLLLFLFPLTPSGFFDGFPTVSEPGALNFYTFFRPIPLALFVSRNFKSFSSFRIPGFSALRSDRTSVSLAFSSLCHAR